MRPHFARQALAPTGWFGPLSVRVRGLFIKHTQIGNPLVDSVAEHQPGTADAYERYLHGSMFTTAPIGFSSPPRILATLTRNRCSYRCTRAWRIISPTEWFV